MSQDESRKLDRFLRHEFYLSNYGVKLNQSGIVKNWKHLRPTVKEDYLEDMYDNLDYSHSVYLYPACRLLQELGWQHLAGLNQLARKLSNHK